jgi:signal transduction histidine kinase
MKSASGVLILNVDDDDGGRYVKTRILHRAGFQVVEAINGTDGLALARLYLPDLVLLDIQLPDINGLEVCRRIKSDPRLSSILVLQTSAAATGLEDRIKGLEGGADNYLVTPIDADELVANVRALLRLGGVQKELRDSDERFRQLADNIQDVFWMFDAINGEVLYLSPAYEPMWKQAAGLLYLKPDAWIDAVFEEDRERISESFASLKETGSYDQEFRLHDGKSWVRDRAYTVKNEEGQIYRIARITSDMTTVKEMENLLRSADSHKDEFLATLAHELRNPLGPIRNAVALLDLRAQNQQGNSLAHEAEDKKYRNIISRQVDHLAHLVDDLLDVARISSGKIELRLDELEMRQLLTAAVGNASVWMLQREQTWHMQLPLFDVWIHGDEVRIAQAINNLLHNASKFTPNGGHIEIEMEVGVDEVLTISIRDNGIGIVQENLSHIFEMFAQHGTAPEKASDGLGIGLALSSRLIQMHKGRVFAASPGLGQGSVFKIELPILRTDWAEENPDDKAVAYERAHDEPARILLVDDNPDALEILSLLLGELGFVTFTAINASSALEAARTQRPDIAILDIGLPGVSGYELAEQMKRDASLNHIRLIALTGFGAEQDVKKAQGAGFSAHIAKPAQIDQLLALLNES